MFITLRRYVSISINEMAMIRLIKDNDMCPHVYVYVKRRRPAFKIKRNYLETIAAIIKSFMFSGPEKTIRLLGSQGNENIARNCEQI